MHDCAANAFNYGIYETDFSNAGPTYVAFVDIGRCDTHVSIVSFEAAAYEDAVTCSFFFFFYLRGVSGPAYAHHDYSPRPTGHPASPGAGKAPRG